MKRSCKGEVKTELSTDEDSSSTETVKHLEQIMTRFSNLYWSEEFFDVVLVINERVKLNAHRVVLALTSEVFCSMFSKQGWQESRVEEVKLTEDESCVDHMEPFLQYFYTGTVTIDAENLFPLLMLTDKYGMEPLRRSCEKYALRNIGTGPVGQALAWWRQAEHVNFSKLEEACHRIVALNTAVLLGSSDWLSLEPERLYSLLNSTDLVVESELQLFQAVKRWLFHNGAKTKEVLRHIRFPLMSPEDVYDPSFADSLPEDVRQVFLTESAMIYQVNSVPIRTISLYHNIHAPSFTMRRYTSQDFGSSQKIEGIDGCPQVSYEFSTKLFQCKTSWKVMSSHNPHKDHYCSSPQVPLLKQPWTCRVDDCSLADDTHSHQLCVLMYRRVGDAWLVFDHKTFPVPHRQDVPMGQLLEKFEKNLCTHKNMVLAHFIGMTHWAKFNK